MTTGSNVDIIARVKQLIPKRWFRFVAPYRDAILGGLADSASWNYGLIIYARAQTRLATAYGVWLDIFAFDFLGRTMTRNNAPDDAFRALIRATILQERVTRAGMTAAITALTGNVPGVFEPWNAGDTGAYSAPGPTGVKYGSMGYGVGHGGYGNMNLPGQVFLKITRGAPSGIPSVGGWGNTVEGWGVGTVEYAGALTALAGITNAMIYQLINLTKPTGSTMWTAIGVFPPGAIPRPLIFKGKADSQNLAVI